MRPPSRACTSASATASPQDQSHRLLRSASCLAFSGWRRFAEGGGSATETVRRPLLDRRNAAPHCPDDAIAPWRPVHRKHREADSQGGSRRGMTTA